MCRLFSGFTSLSQAFCQKLGFLSHTHLSETGKYSGVNVVDSAEMNVLWHYVVVPYINQLVFVFFFGLGMFTAPG